MLGALVLLVGEIVLGLALTAAALYVRRRQGIRTTDPFGSVVLVIFGSFGLAKFLGDGVLAGFWMIAGYARDGGNLEDHLLPGTSMQTMVWFLDIALVVSLAAAIRTYVVLLISRRRRRGP